MTGPKEVAISSNLLQKIVERTGDDVVLVGGQALGFWAQHYDIGLQLAEFGGSVSKDADFLGKRKHLDAIKDGFGDSAKIELAPRRGLTALVGSVQIRLSDAEFVNIDVIHKVHGLDTNHVIKTATKVKVGDAFILIMHPLDVLESRVANLAHLKDKQQPGSNGKVQAHLAICVARRYVEELAVDPGKEAQALRAIEKIVSIAKSGAGRRVSRDYAVRFFSAIPERSIRTEEFHHRRWPQICDELATAAAHGKEQKPNDSPPEDEKHDPCR
ncbi:hypothetical protein ACMX25_40300 [Caballeronia sp. 15715]|uniref:hypothetical protein n=1 Tax=Caballeronia sp. 15715 TaxID=3391030 RepID=UPI0039E2D1AA